MIKFNTDPGVCPTCMCVAHDMPHMHVGEDIIVPVGPPSPFSPPARLVRLARLWTASLIRAALARGHFDGGVFAHELVPDTFRDAPPIVAAAVSADAALGRDVVAEMERIMEEMER